MSHRLKVAPDGRLTYEYDCDLHGPDVSCAFHLFCEVGEHYKRRFLDDLKGRTVDTRELPQAPWLADYDRARTSSWVRLNCPVTSTKEYP